MWIGRRSPTKSTWPGLLDHLVAGQQPSGITPMENVLKEAEEEAGVPAHLAARAVATGAISYLGLDEEVRAPPPTSLPRARSRPSRAPMLPGAPENTLPERHGIALAA